MEYARQPTADEEARIVALLKKAVSWKPSGGRYRVSVPVWAAPA